MKVSKGKFYFAGDGFSKNCIKSSCKNINLLNIVANLFSKPVSEDENETDSIFKVRVRPSSFSRCFGPVAAYTMPCASGHPVPAEGQFWTPSNSKGC